MKTKSLLFALCLLVVGCAQQKSDCVDSSDTTKQEYIAVEDTVPYDDDLTQAL